MAGRGSEEYHDDPLKLCDTCTHKKKKIEQCCDTHNVVCCSTCKLLYHESCKVTTLKKKTQTGNQHKQIGDSLQLIQELQKDIQQMNAEKKRGTNPLTSHRNKCFNEVRALMTELVDLFKKLEREVLEKVKQREANIRSRIERQITESEQFLPQLDDCKSMLERCQSTRDDVLMCIVNYKSRDRIETIEKLVAELQNDIISTDLQFEAEQDVKDMIKNLKRLGEVKSGTSMRHTARATGATSSGSGVSAASQRTSDDTSDVSTGNTAQATGDRNELNLLDVTVLSHRDLDVNSCNIGGSTFLENGELVLCDRTNSKLLLFNTDLTPKAELEMPGQPFSVAAITECRVAVTTPYDGDQLIFVDTTPTMSVTDKRKLKSRMFGIVCRKQLYVVFNGYHDQGGVHGGVGGQHEILVVEHNGRQDRTINLSAVGMRNPLCIEVNEDESKIFVSDSRYIGNDSVWCIDCQSGNALFRFHCKELDDPNGLFVDPNNDVLMICWSFSHKITLLTAEGRDKGTLLSHKDGLDYPQTVTYKPQDGTLVVGMKSSPACRVFRLKSK